MKLILQSKLPVLPWMQEKTRKLPGVHPLAIENWLERDDAFKQQMAFRDELVTSKTDLVYAAKDESRPAQKELLSLIIASLDDEYQISQNAIRRPDGVNVPLEGPPILVAARLVQEDLLILEDQNLSAGVLCFPASWTLKEKFGRSLVGLHGNVVEYDDNIAKRVSRLFDAIRPEQPLWRANYMLYRDPDLFQPRREQDVRQAEGGDFVRVEKQSLLRLPQTKAVIFGIHTYVVPIKSLTDVERITLYNHLS